MLFFVLSVGELECSVSSARFAGCLKVRILKFLAPKVHWICNTKESKFRELICCIDAF